MKGFRLSKIKVVWATPNAEEAVAYCARVSNPENQNAQETAPKLLKYLIKHKHWSPFEMVNVCMEIETTRDIARQILRHRSFSFQEFSQRYAAVQGFELSEARLQDLKNRQNSIEVGDDTLHNWWFKAQKRIQEDTELMYNMALAKGIAKEQARKLLPEGMTMSKMYMNGTLRSWLHYVDIRCDKATQKEHREVAEKCRDELTKLFPNVMSAFRAEEAFNAI
jgi:thymidylate synthase (FAD)